MLLLSRWINRQVQVIGLRLSGDMNVAIMVYYLLMFPGIVLHELSHYRDGAAAGHAGGQVLRWGRRSGAMPSSSAP